jgi:hypothetical protein
MPPPPETDSADPSRVAARIQMVEFEFTVRQGCARGWPNHCARSQRSNLARIQKVPGSNRRLDTELLGEQASEPKVRIRSCKF